MNFINKSIAFVFNNKAVVTLSVLLFAFFISTISLAVQKNNARTALRYCQSDYDECIEKCKGDKGNETSSSTTETETTTTTLPPVENDYRLPSNIVPISYDLTLRPNIVDGTFTGTNRIHINVTSSAFKILIHSHLLNIRSVILTGREGELIQSEFRLQDEKLERLEITLASPLPRTGSSEAVFVTIEFDGSLEDRIVGLYKSTYFNGVENSCFISVALFSVLSMFCCSLVCCCSN